MQVKQSFRGGNNINYRPGMANISPKKNKMLMGVTFSKKASIKTLNTSNTKDNNALYYRCSAHSIQQLHHSNSVENVEIERKSLTKHDGSEEMFGRSYAKIHKLKGTFANRQIDGELNDILILIKEEKQKIRDRLKHLQSSNHYFRRICEGAKISKVDAAANTEDLIDDGLETECLDRAVQCDQADLSMIPRNKESEEKGKKISDAYGKLKTMLAQMSINPSHILPEEGKQAKQDPTRQFKALSDGQIIKIQQFFIKKLAVKLPK